MTPWERVRLVLAHITIYVAALLFMLPLVYAFFSALKPNGEMFAMPPSLFGSEIRWSNFAEVFEYGPFWTYIGNSLFTSVAGTLVVLVVSTTAGYAFGRLRWKGRDAVFVLFLATLMVPAEVLVIPMFQVMQWFGWVDTYQALIFPFAFGAFGTFLMRQFFRGIPYELEEAARVDGAGPVRTFLQIILPLSKSAVAVLAVFTFLSFWNSYLWPLIVTVDYNNLGTLPVGLASFSGLTGTRWDLQMAASIISMIPTTILVIALQKHLVKGIAMAGLGGR
ncbi:carbohydrate ABC transporter permease [Microbacterium esteraromaticum]|uniref:Carbohydrate ABC transporter permease n=2 Tax=Microbacterium esteraromaticum TaxID=57043 RepID=A0A939IV00_9MICO|nr:carbohydrate ABC transporter permease [Microbacterium esteraromaticum]MBN8205941.1 carbohydrate ABC transporter permease [Microbacterium esteraromaticum]MBN8416096.1 carbohydrate ABC transporter permease [Microbacterium esteraromaticum]MBN8423566.1 carbohydrate ABC transporter permease [Microbacterium esteraromaticum]MBY6060913.1 carbohydrate ABC transporter permease [Microbacterium esteraromaticum]